jgi:hypothetical protein
METWQWTREQRKERKERLNSRRGRAQAHFRIRQLTAHRAAPVTSKDEREPEGKALPMERVGRPGRYEAAQDRRASSLNPPLHIVFSRCDFERHALLFHKTRTLTTVANADVVEQGRRWCGVVE